MHDNQSLHPITLAFRSHALERAFSEASFAPITQQGRIAIVVGSLVFLLTAILDQWFVPAEYASQVWQTRLTALGMPALVFAVSYTRWFRRLHNLLLASVGMAAGVGVIAMQSFLPVENAGAFYPAVALATFFSYNFVGTRFVFALFVDLLLVSGYNVVFGCLHGYPTHVLVSHDFLIVSANLVGGSAGYLAERQRRMLFLRERELEKANLAKSRFLAAASHDLRQPLYAVNLLIEALRHESEPARALAVVDQLGSAAQSLDELLSELLDISRLEAGTVHPRIGVFRLQPLFDTLERELRPVAEEKGIELGFAATRVWVRSDPHMLGRILRNLITNAIRYTDRGAVLVGCRRKGARIAIAVHDSGPGIAPEHQEAIFREFFQIGNPERDRRKGLGLGLAIVDRLCGLLDHPLDLRSEIGKGTVFSVEVPRATEQEGAVAREAAVHVGALSGAAILIIDDEQAICQALSEVLGRWGCATLTAGSAEEAIERLADNGFKPHAIIADYRLREGHTGAEAIHAVRRFLRHRVPAMIVTGDTAPERLREAAASGHLLLHKPLQPTMLRVALASLIGETAT